MAERRMFAKSIIGSARFLRMPVSARLLYYDLGMQADDDGVVEAFAVMRTTGASEDDLTLLAVKGFVRILNDDLVTFITDWKNNNTIRSDRYHKSIYSELLKSTLELPVCIPNGNQMETVGIPIDNQTTTKPQPNDNQMETEVRLGEDSIDKNSIDNNICSNSDDFEQFWELYPKKIGKGNAQKAFNKAIKKAGVNVQVLIDAVETQKCSERWNKNKGEFIPLPATWLNQERWGDDLAEVSVSVPMYTELEEGELPF